MSEHNDISKARMKKTFDETVAKIGAGREKQLKDAVALNAEMLLLIKLVANGIAKGVIEDQTLISTNEGGRSTKLTPLSKMLSDMISKAEGRS